MKKYLFTIIAIVVVNFCAAQQINYLDPTSSSSFIFQPFAFVTQTTGIIPNTNDNAFQSNTNIVQVANQINYKDVETMDIIKKDKKAVFLVNGNFLPNINNYEEWAIADMYKLRNKSFPTLKEKFKGKHVYMVRLTDVGEKCFFSTNSNNKETKIDSIFKLQSCYTAVIKSDSMFLNVKSLPTLQLNNENKLYISNVGIDWNNVTITTNDAILTGKDGDYIISNITNCIVRIVVEKTFLDFRKEKTTYFFAAK